MAYTAKPATLPEFATAAASSTIIGSLDIDTIEFQATYADGARVRYTFNGSPDLSTSTIDHDLTVASAASSVNNGTFRILAVSNADDYIDIYNPNVTSNSTDAASDAAGTGTVVQNAARLVTPTTGRKSAGWRSPQKPNDGIINWLAYWAYQWLYMLDQNYPTGYLLQGRLTAGSGITISNNGDNTQLIGADLTGAIATEQTGHGFAITNAIIYDGADWVEASSTGAPSGCNDPWIVVSIEDANNFTRQKRGAATITGHGLKGQSNVIWDTGDVDGIAWQSGTTVRHTWGTNVDLSGVAIGDWVHLKLDNSSGTTTEYYDLQSGYYKITAVSDGSNYIEWSNPYITASTYDISTLVDSDNRIIIYGDAGAGDMQYLSEVDGELSPFPANGGHIELPLAVVIDEDNIEIIGTVGVPKIARPKTILRLVNKETPNDGDDDFELIGRQRISFANPQNWRLKFNFWSFDGTSPLSIDIGNATHRGGEDSLFLDDNADQTLDEDNSFSTGDTAAITLDQLTLTLGGLGVVGNEKGFAEMTYDGQYLFFNAQSFGDDGSTYRQVILKMVDLSAAYFKDCGNTNLDYFDLFVTRV